ncbi:MAG: hypothetical protein P2A85_03930 [Microcoleus anatoxicus]|uniref:hypothetical protein n=1 Tax=Microcoleus anatoxicus TaxID=2705319 RepID=UPI00366D69AE
MIQAIEREARRLGVNSESLIKVWIGERLEKHLAVAMTDEYRSFVWKGDRSLNNI